LTSLVAECSIRASGLDGSDDGVGRFGGAAGLSVVRIGPRVGIKPRASTAAADRLRCIEASPRVSESAGVSRRAPDEGR